VTKIKNRPFASLHLMKINGKINIKKLSGKEGIT
jgi:hypothetical protein